MNRKILMTLFEAMILLDVVQIVSSKNNGPLHFACRNHHPFQDSATDTHIPSERALLVDIIAILSLLGALDAKQTFGADEDSILFLKSFLCLIHGESELALE